MVYVDDKKIKLVKFFEMICGVICMYNATHRKYKFKRVCRSIVTIYQGVLI